jgi:hypothetical protein
MNELDLDDGDLARLLSVGRVVAGGLLFIAPRRAARAWTGENEDSAISVMAVRGLGARDMAIGMGTLVAIERGGDVGGWLRAGAASDATDALSVLAHFGRLPDIRRWLLGATACGAAYIGWSVAARLD